MAAPKAKNIPRQALFIWDDTTKEYKAWDGSTTGGSGSTQYAEDSAHSSGDTGTMALGVRQDVVGSLASTDGDYTPSSYDGSGRLWTHDPLAESLLTSIDGKDFATQTTLDALLTELQAKADLTETQPVSAASLPLPTGAATAANQQTDALTNIELRASDVKVTLDGEQVDIKPLGTVGNGQKTVATAGTAESLGASTTIRSITIKALANNSNNVYIGDSSVSSSNGFVLDAGDTISLDIDNLADIYIDVDTNGEGVSFIYLI